MYFCDTDLFLGKAKKRRIRVILAASVLNFSVVFKLGHHPERELLDSWEA
jgi:hypothetical protein